MHELSLVAELVAECERRAQGADVSFIRVRRASTIAVEALRQAFVMLSTDTTLARADLEVESFDLSYTCRCGNTGPLGHDHVIGHMVICPSCGSVSSNDQAELELLEMGIDE